MLRPGQQINPYVVAAIIAVVLLLWMSMSGSAAQDRYAIMMDAGSTGSRIHVYHFRANAGGDLVLQSEMFQQLEPGLSSYADEPEEGAKSLIPLLDAAARTVPSNLKSQTPLELKATAGLRLLQPSQAEALLTAVRQLLGSYGFAFDPARGVEIMDGLDEGLFGWVTVNYLLQTIRNEPTRTAVVLDLGGGSTQVAMSVQQSQSKLPVTSLFGTSHHMYLFSHLGYGLMAGRAAVLTHSLGDKAAAAADGGGKHSLTHGCFHQDITAEYSYGQAAFSIKGAAGSNAIACHRAVSTALTSPTSSLQLNKGPTPQNGQPVFAMSYYFDRAMNVGLIAPGGLGAKVKPANFHSAAETVCQMSPGQIREKYPTVKAQDAPFLCLDLCFISNLLQHGFGLHEDATITLAKKIDFNGEKVETAWSLGAALNAMFNRPEL